MTEVPSETFRGLAEPEVKLEEPGDLLAALAEGGSDIGFELHVAEGV